MNNNFKVISIISIVLLLATNYSFAQPPSLQVLGLFKDKAYIVYEGQSRVASAGEKISKDLTLIEADSKRAIFDYKGDQYIFGISFHISSDFDRPINTNTKPKQAKGIIIVANDEGEYRTEIYINGDKTDATFELDGKANLLSSNYANRIGLNYDTNNSFYIDLENGRSTGYSTIIDEIIIDKIKVEKISATIILGSYPDEPILGNKFLELVNAKHNKSKEELMIPNK